MKVSPDHFFSTQHLGHDLRRRSVRGGVVTSCAQLIKFTLRFASIAILARLLTPEDYGLIAMTTVVTGFVGLFKDAGLASATVQRDSISHAQASTLFWINFALGCLLAFVLVALAPAVAAFYGDHRLQGITCALSVSFLLGGLTVQHQALLRRQMRFWNLAVIEVFSMAAGIAAAVSLARMNMGYWSLVGMVQVTAAVNAAAVWLALPWRPSLPCSRCEIGSFLKFGGDILGFNVVNYFSRQADNLLIGWHWGAISLGFYEKAYSLLLLPVSQINAPINAVIIPALSRARANSAAFKRFFLGAFETVTCVSAPTIFLIAAFADEVVAVLLGPQWQESARLFRLLSVAALLGALSNPLGWLLISSGLTKRYRQIGIVSAPLIVASFVVGLGFGAQGVALAYSVIMLILFIPTWLWALHATAISLFELIRCLVPSLLSSSFAIAVALSVASWLRPDQLTRLLAGICVFCFVYAAVFLGAFRRYHALALLLKELFGKPTNTSATASDVSRKLDRCTERCRR